jgi:hypothetical protein
MRQILDDSAAATTALHSETSSHVLEHVPVGVDEMHDSPATLRLDKKGKKRSRPAGGRT